MKSVLAAAIVLMAPILALAQAAKPAPAPAAGTPTAKPTAAKSAATKPAPAKTPSKVRRSALKAVEEVTPIDDDPNVTLSMEDLAIAKRVFVGAIQCELGSTVTITPSEKREGFFRVQTKTASFRMHPVESRTGAIRLEDPRAGAMWLQLGNKSMLMSQRLGQRLADECVNPDQAVVAEMLRKNPLPSILDAPTATVTK